MKVHLTALGCRLNEAELETWSREFSAKGHQLCSDASAADIAVINTCAVTDEAVRKSRKLLRRMHRDNPSAKLVVSGCYATLTPEEPDSLPGVDLVVANQNKSQLVQIVSDQLDLHTMPAMATEPGENLLFARGRQRAFIKVQDGCRYQCTYCIVTKARGDESSRPLNEIVDEINSLHQDGIQEVVLAGVHLGGYGSDNGSDISQLVAEVLKQTNIPRVRLGSIEPWDIPEDFWQLFESPRLMPHLHMPLQSGANSVLRRMSRRCKTEDFSQLLENARRDVSDFNVTTDIIVGFPGETEEEWQSTMEYMEQTGFGHIHIFPFSPRSGTKAATLPNQVADELKKRRCAELDALASQWKQQTMENYIGRSMPVLVEGDKPQKNGLWNGYTPNFLRVGIKAPETEGLSNKIIEVKLNVIKDELLVAQLH